MEQFVAKLRKEYTHLHFTSGAAASWSPHKKEVSYAHADTQENRWSILHELGHALLEHTSYTSDIDLLKKEAAAWQRAITLAEQYGIQINEEHVQNCLDTYRDWLHKRSTCPTCGSHGIQRTQSLYVCLNCKDTWKVSSARFCRPYRLKMAHSTN